MNTSLYTYEPANQSYGIVWLALGVFVLGAAVAVWLFRHTSTSSAYTGMLSMLAGFAALIALGTGVFGWLALAKNKTLRICTDRVEFGTHIIPYQNLKNAALEESKTTALFNPNSVQKSVQLLFLQEKCGRTHVLSGAYYPVQEILTNLRAAINNWESARSK